MKTLSVLVLPGSLADGAVITLDDPERHHLAVRRAEAGTEVLVFDGVGNVAHGTLTNGLDGVSVGVVQRAPAPARTVLAVGAGDKERFLALAERSTELGMSGLVALSTERSHTVDSRFRDSALAKAQRRAREACKQSENSWAAIVEGSCPLRELARRQPGLRWLVAQPGAGACPPIAADEAIGWVIGPEGGLTSDESSFLIDTLGATPVGLGPAVLRFDTAAIAAAVLTNDRRAATGE